MYYGSDIYPNLNLNLSLSVQGSKLFNIIPRELRDMNHENVELFKSGLDRWLTTIPDEPSIPGRQRAAITNSLLDQIVLHDNYLNTAV